MKVALVDILARSLACAVLALAATASAEAPALLPIQGYLTAADGTPLADDKYAIRFRLYASADPAQTTALHDETIDVDVKDGYFTVYLGDTANGGEALDMTVFRDMSTVFLGLKVGTDAEAVPRLQMASTAFAATANYCDSLAGGALGSVPYQSGDGATAMLAPGSTGALLASNAGAAPKWFAGSAGDTMRYDAASGWTVSGNVYDDGARVGIGINDPSANLHVYAARTAEIRVEGAGTGGPSSTAVVRLMRGMPRRAAGMFVENIDSAWFVGQPYNAGADQTQLQFGYDATQAEYSGNYMFRITTAGDATLRGSLTQMSDARLKKNIRPIENALETITKLQGVSFEWQKPAEHGNQVGPRMGMIAQQVEQVLPNWVSTDPDGTKMIAYIGFEGLAVEAIRDLKTDYERLQAQNARLEAANKTLIERLDKLEARVAATGAKP